MEDVLEVDAEPYEPTRPKVNLEEPSKQRIQEPSEPLPTQAGKPPHFDDAYARTGTRHLLRFVEPPAARACDSAPYQAGLCP